MPLCAVLTCKSRTDGPNGPTPGVTFHLFPRNEDTRTKWVDMTGRDNWSPSNTSVVCSKHFRDNDYFIKRSGKRYLKASAIPCEYVVYRHLFPDEDPAPSPPPIVPVVEEPKEPMEQVKPPQGKKQKKEKKREATPKPPNEPDTTSVFDFDVNDNSLGWDQFETLRYFGRQPAAPVVNRRKPKTASPKRPKRKARKSRKSKLQMNQKIPLELAPGAASPSPTVPVLDYSKESKKIKTLVTDKSVSKGEPKQKKGRRSSKGNGKGPRRQDSEATPTMAEIREAENIMSQNRAGNMTELEKAEAIIHLQSEVDSTTDI